MSGNGINLYSQTNPPTISNDFRLLSSDIAFNNSDDIKFTGAIYNSSFNNSENRYVHDHANENFNVPNYLFTGGSCVAGTVNRFTGSYHSNLYIGNNNGTNVLVAWGQNMAAYAKITADGGTDVYTPKMVPTANYAGVPMEVRSSSSGGANGLSALALRTSTKLYFFGTAANRSSITTMTNFGGDSLTSTNSDVTSKLPAGVAITDIAQVAVSQKALALITNSGHVYILTTMVNLQGDKATASSTVWHHVTLSDGTTFLSGVTKFSLSSSGAFALTNLGKLYYWGLPANVAGVVNTATSYNYAYDMSAQIPSGVSVTDLVVLGKSTGTSTLYLLCSNNKVYSNGLNTTNGLGNPNFTSYAVTSAAVTAAAATSSTTFTVTAKPGTIVAGNFLTLINTANPSQKIDGTVSAYTAATGALTITISYQVGATSNTAWTLKVSDKTATTNQATFQTVKGTDGVTDLTNIVRIDGDTEADLYAMGAMTSDGTIYGWGDNAASMLGDPGNASTGSEALPATVQLFTSGGFTDFSMAGHFTIAFYSGAGNDQYWYVGHSTGGSQGAGVATSGTGFTISTSPVVINASSATGLPVGSSISFNCSNTQPTLTTTGTLNAYSACYSTTTASSYQTFTLSGDYLQGNVILTAPSGFELSVSSGSGYTSSITLPQSAGTIASTTIYVRVAKSTAVGAYSGNITIESQAATSATIAVSATVNALPTITGVTGDAIVIPQGTSGPVNLYATASVGATVKWYADPTSGTVLTSGGYYTTTLSISSAFYVAAENGNCASALRTPVYAIVNYQLFAGNVGSNQTICINSVPQAFTSLSDANGGDGTSAILYKWEKSTDGTNWNQIAGALSTSYSEPNALSITTYYRRLSYTSGQAIYQQGYSNTITITISAAPSVATAALNNDRTGAGPVIIGATAPAGTVLDWYATPTGGAVLNNGIGINPFTTPSISNTTIFYAQVRDASLGCLATSRLAVTATINGSMFAGVIGSDQRICAGSTPATLNSTSEPTGGSPEVPGQYLFQWQSSTNNITYTNIASAGTSNTYTPGAISSKTYFRRRATTVNADTAYSNVVTITTDAASNAGTLNSTSLEVCKGLNTIDFTLTGYTGSIQWQYSSDATSFYPINGATSSTYTATNLIANTYFRAVATNGVCAPVNGDPVMAYTYSTSAAVTAQPAAAVKVLTGNSINLSVTATSVSGYKWKKAGNVISGATTNALTINNAELTDAGTYTVALTPSDGCGDFNSTTSTVLVVDTVYSNAAGALTTLGTWGVETNGSGNNPTSFTNRTTHVYQLRNRTSNVAGLTGNFTIAGTLDVSNTELTVGAGYTLQAGKIARTTGGAGLLNTTGNSNIVLTGVSGVASELYFKTGSFLKNLTLSAGAPANLNAALSIADSGTVTCGALFATNNNLTLKSTINGDASVGLGSESGGYITGNVKVERYVGTNRDWRMIGFPFSGNLTANTISPFFTGTLTCYWYDESLDDGKYGNSGPGNAGWVPFTGTATTPYSKGLLLYGGNNSTIKISNPLKTGTQTFSLGYSTGRPNRGWHLVANPFASKLDWDVIVSLQANKGQKIAKAIYRWDPGAQGYASYINGFAAGRQSNIIENGASFFVSLSDVSVLTIPESSKTSTAPDGRLFSVPNIGEIRQLSDGSSQSVIKLYLQKQGDEVADQVILRWGNAANATDAFDADYDAYDMGRKNGPDLGVLGSDNTLYSIYHGSELKTAQDEHRSISLNTTNLEEANNYVLKTELLSPLTGTNNAYIFDKYTGDYTPIEATAKAYSFTVNGDTLSKSATRFLLVFNKHSGVAAEENNAGNGGLQVIGNPMKGNTINLLSNGNYKNVLWQLIDNNGNQLSAGKLSDVQKGTIISIKNSKELLSGIYLVKLNGDGKVLNTLKILK